MTAKFFKLSHISESLLALILNLYSTSGVSLQVFQWILCVFCVCLIVVWLMWMLQDTFVPLSFSEVTAGASFMEHVFWCVKICISSTMEVVLAFHNDRPPHNYNVNVSVGNLQFRFRDNLYDVFSTVARIAKCLPWRYEYLVDAKLGVFIYLVVVYEILPLLIKVGM